MAYHRTLLHLNLPFKARAAIHVGPVTLRRNGAADMALGAKPLEVEGVAKSTTARVLSLAQAGQTLLTREARDALDGTECTVMSHGFWRLKGLTEPRELFEVGDGCTLFQPPPDGPKAYRVVRQSNLWMPARDIKHSLPAERDTFVGRDDKLLELGRRLDEGGRLLSVVGMGGMGKTRLVCRFAWTWLGSFPGGVWFCDLSQARSLEGIAFAVAQGLDVPLGRDPIAQLGHAIASRGRCLVILDNFEQVAGHAEASVGQWLARAKEACFLVSTREVLGIPGEGVMPLHPLPARDAAALFVQRAASAAPRFVPTAEDTTSISRLVGLLDGLPLAIELAAARVRIMRPATLLQRMGERFRLLASSRGREPRQATLRAAFDWSWDLLTGTEKAALAQLSVFEGGFTLASAEAVVADLPEAPWITDVIQSLVDKSFVRQVREDRLDLLGSIQAYASEHLRTDGRYPGSGAAAVAAAQARHAHHYAALGSTAQACVELDNVVAACRRATVQGLLEDAVATLEAAWGALRLRGPFKVGAELALLVRNAMPQDDEKAARASLIAGRALQACGRIGEAREQLDSAAKMAEKHGLLALQGRALGYLAEFEGLAGRVDSAQQNFDIALRIAREKQDPVAECDTLNARGTFRENQGKLTAASEDYEAALALARAVGDRRWEGGTLGNLGQLRANQGLGEQARALYREAASIARELGDRQWEGNALCNLGLLDQAEGHLDDAETHLTASLAIARDLGYVRLEAVVLCNVGLLHDALRRWDLAQSNYEAALAIARDLDDKRSQGQFLTYLGLLHARNGRVDEARSCLIEAQALLHSVSDNLSLGLALCCRAEAEHLAGCAEAALAASDAAEALALSEVPASQSEFGAALTRVRSLLARSVVGA
jgi:predicted ATPase